MTDVAGGLITLEYAKEGLGYTGTSTARDKDVAAYIQAATPVIEFICGAVLLQEKTKRFNGGKTGIALTDRIAEDAIVSVLEDGTPITDYVVDEDSRIIYAGTSGSARRFGAGRKNITVTYTTGYRSVPLTLQLATRELVVHWVQQGKQAPSPQFDGTYDTSSPGTPLGFAIPNRVAELCAPYRIAGGIG